MTRTVPRSLLSCFLPTIIACVATGRGSIQVVIISQPQQEQRPSLWGRFQLFSNDNQQSSAAPSSITLHQEQPEPAQQASTPAPKDKEPSTEVTSEQTQEANNKPEQNMSSNEQQQQQQPQQEPQQEQAQDQQQQQGGLSEEDKKLAVRLAQIIESSNEK